MRVRGPKSDLGMHLSMQKKRTRARARVLFSIGVLHWLNSGQCRKNPKMVKIDPFFWCPLNQRSPKSPLKITGKDQKWVKKGGQKMGRKVPKWPFWGHFWDPLKSSFYLLEPHKCQKKEVKNRVKKWPKRAQNDPISTPFYTPYFPKIPWKLWGGGQKKGVQTDPPKIWMCKLLTSVRTPMEFPGSGPKIV